MTAPWWVQLVAKRIDVELCEMRPEVALKKTIKCM